jgi:hypothetical protein
MKKLIVILMLLCLPVSVFAFTPSVWLDPQNPSLLNYSKLISSTSGWFYGVIWNTPSASGNSNYTINILDAGTTITTVSATTRTPYIVPPIRIGGPTNTGTSEPFVLYLPTPIPYNNGLCVELSGTSGVTPYYMILKRDK